MKMIFSCLLFLIFQSKIQAQNRTLQDSTVKINITFSDHRPDTIELYLFEQRFGIARTGKKIFRQFSKTGFFNFSIGGLKDIAYVLIESKEKPRLYLDNYLIEPGDSITLSVNPQEAKQAGIIQKNHINISGRGALKYQARLEIDGLEDIRKAKAISKARLIRYWGPMDSILPHYDSIYTNNRIPLINCLNRYRPFLSKKVYEIIRADIYYSSILNLFLVAGFCREFTKNKPDSIARLLALRRVYETRIEKEKEADSTTETGRYYSWAYIEFLNKKLFWAANPVRTLRSRKSAIDYLPLINTIGGPLSNKLFTSFATLLYLFTPAIDNPEALFTKETIQAQALDAYQQELLNNIIERLISNKPFYPFRLPDNNGKIISLEDLKGKKCLIDFWFTGCIPCQIQEKYLKIIKQKVANDSSIALVSINLDWEKSTWLESLKTELYSEKENINLFAEGLGSSHPLLLHYNISAVPRLMLINSKGVLVDPHIEQIKSEASVDKMVQVLKATD